MSVGSATVPAADTLLADLEEFIEENSYSAALVCVNGVCRWAKFGLTALLISYCLDTFPAETAVR
jgi:hypothetical protein